MKIRNAALAMNCKKFKFKHWNY